MKPWNFAGIALCCCLILPGCDDSASDAATAALEGTPWKLAAWSVSSLDPAGFEITADFADGRIGGRSAVNSYGGDCSASTDGSFSVGPVAMTEMAGEPDAMRAEMSASRTKLPLFDYGPGIEALRANCEAETGLPAPVQPVWAAMREAAE